MLGKDDSYFGNDDSFFSLRNHLPVITVIEGTSLFCRRRRSQFMSELTLVKWKSDWHLHLVAARESIRLVPSLGRVAARESKCLS